MRPARAGSNVPLMQIDAGGNPSSGIDARNSGGAWPARSSRVMGRSAVVTYPAASTNRANWAFVTSVRSI